MPDTTSRVFGRSVGGGSVVEGEVEVVVVVVVAAAAVVDVVGAPTSNVRSGA
jgi:hypothetical protein